MMTAKTNHKTDLVQAIQELLTKNTISTQEDICLALQKKGFDVNQVKVSRLLHKVGAIKMIEGERTVYRLPTTLIAFSPNDSLKHLILNINHNESLIVIRTAPGSAQLVAGLLDKGKEIGILGTVAGDDTIFIAPIKTQQIKQVFQKVYALLLS